MRLFLAAVAVLYLAGCETTSPPGAFEPGVTPASVLAKLKTPAVIALDYDNERLVYWPMNKLGGSTPAYLTYTGGCSGAVTTIPNTLPN